MRNQVIRKLKPLLIGSVGSFFAGGVAFAHPGHALDQVGAGASSFWGGFLHPLTGLDHVLAMVAVGMWAVQRRGGALWIWPAVFVGMMLCGWFLGLAGAVPPAIEQAIAASVFVLGLAVAVSFRAPLAAGAVLIGAFALFHGAAHGLEAPQDGRQVYMLGFALATVVLHGVGIGIGRCAALAQNSVLMRFAGVVIACFGVALFAYA